MFKLSYAQYSRACWNSPEFGSFVSLSPKVDLFFQTWVPPCFWAFQGLLPPTCRHLRDVKYETVTQQPGTGSRDPATNWNFKVHVKFVPTWNVARAPGQISGLQQEAAGATGRPAGAAPTRRCLCAWPLRAWVRQLRHQPYFWLCPFKMGD